MGSELTPEILDALKDALEKEAARPYRELALEVRSYVFETLDDDLIPTIGESYIAFGAACAHRAAERLADLERTFDLQWKADMRAIEHWQSENPGNDLVWPDRKELTLWLLNKAFPKIEEHSNAK
jgi:hypothetical protein